MCPRCKSPQLDPILTMEHGVDMRSWWCMVCSYATEPEPYIGLEQSVLSARCVTAGLGDERTEARWNLFQKVLESYEDNDGIPLRDLYRRAQKKPGQWFATAPLVGIRELLRAVLLLSWEPLQKQMAIRVGVGGGIVDLAFNADKVMPRHQLRPNWWDLVRASWSRGWVAQYYDRD